MARVICIANQKGGVGKTTTAINLSASIAVAEKKVLLIDIDPQGNSTSGMGFRKEDPRETIYHALLRGSGLKDMIQKTNLSYLDMVTSNTDLIGEEVELIQIKEREKKLARLIREVEADYDYIFIDCPPSLGLLTINSLTAAHSVIIPLQCEYYAMEGLGQLLKTIRRAFGRAVESLGGRYYTAEDSGVSEHDLEIVREVTKYAAGVSQKGVGGNPSPFTARGVWRGIEAAAQAKFGRSSLAGLRASILGVGAVGMALAELLHEAGASLVVADVNDAAVREAVKRFDALAVAPDDCIGADVDIFSPCALGGSINRDTIGRLRGTVVAGAANNQLATCWI